MHATGKGMITLDYPSTTESIFGTWVAATLRAETCRYWSIYYLIVLVDHRRSQGQSENEL